MRFGRTLVGVGLFAALVALFWFGGILSANDGSIAPESKAVALFFAAIIAYSVPVFHYVTTVTEQQLQSLLHEIGDADDAKEHLPAERSALPELISRRSVPWQVSNVLFGTFLWLLQSWFLAGGWSGMAHSLTHSLPDALMALGALPVWVFTTVIIAALVSNAQLIRRLTQWVKLDVLNSTALMAFGRVSVTAVLVVIGLQASFSIMFFGGVDSVWAWGPGLLLTSSALVFLLLAPVLPLRRRLRRAKAQALASVNAELARTNGVGDLGSADARRRLSELLLIRQEIRAAPEWPFDMHLLARLGIYLVIVPLTWVGAALIENLVDLVVG